jgi:hypothetical protein
MKKLKIMSVVGTRPEIIRLSRVLAALDAHCEHVLVHTGQNYDYELNQVFFDDLGVRKPDYFLNSAEGSTSAAHTIGNLITAVDGVLAKEQPEAMLVLGDTNSCLSVIPAKRRKVPIFHMEAGNRCFDQRCSSFDIDCCHQCRRLSPTSNWYCLPFVHRVFCPAPMESGYLDVDCSGGADNHWRDDNARYIPDGAPTNRPRPAP